MAALLLGARTLFSLTAEEWRSTASAVADVITSLGLLVAAYWAWRRFRRSPESRAKFRVAVDPVWETTSTGLNFIRARVTAFNEGGRSWTLQPTEQGGCRVVCWTRDSTEHDGEPPGPSYIPWEDQPVDSGALLAEDYTLHPTDRWADSHVFAVGSSVVAARITAFLVILDGGAPLTVEDSEIVVKPDRDEVTR